MALTGPRIALSAIAALAATAVFTGPADATVFNQSISVRPYAHINEDGSVTLSGTYQCERAPHTSAVQVKATLVQDDVHLTVGAGDAVCDGAPHHWNAQGSLAFTPRVHPGAAQAVAQLQEIHLSGLFPKSIDTVAEDRQDIQVIAHH